MLRLEIRVVVDDANPNTPPERLTSVAVSSLSREDLTGDLPPRVAQAIVALQHNCSELFKGKSPVSIPADKFDRSFEQLCRLLNMVQTDKFRTMDLQTWNQNGKEFLLFSLQRR